jgi:L-lactate dehydrogenase complex protein LldG
MADRQAREEIIARLRRATPARAGGPDPRQASSRPVAGWAQRAERFAAAARAAAATVECVAETGAVEEAVARYLAAHGLPPAVHLSADPPGCGGGQLSVDPGPLRPDGDTVVTGCLAALAEEGAIVMASGADHAAESVFLAATHVVVVEGQRLIDSMDSLWPFLRSGGALPRMINVILGPSRTADLGVPSRLGAHGPLRVHIILVGEAGLAARTGPEAVRDVC